MTCTLITGMSATGKSSTVLRLAAQGHRAVDLDADGWSEHVADDSEWAADDPDATDWRWREDRVRTLGHRGGRGDGGGARARAPAGLPRLTARGTAVCEGEAMDPVAVPLRWVDVDALGHVYHATYLTLLDEARSRFLAAAGVHAPSDHVVARVEVDYLAPIGPGHGEVHVAHAVERVGRTSTTLRATIATPDGVERARALVVVVLWDLGAAGPRPLDADERAALVRFEEAGGTPER